MSSLFLLQVWDVNIPVASNTELSFWSYPVNALGRYVSVDLLMTDGSTLRGTAAVDSNGVSMKPSTGRGIINTWTKTKCNIGTWLNGKTIDKILVGYDNGPSTCDFSSYIDDISINTAGTQQMVSNAYSCKEVPGISNSEGGQHVYILNNPFTNSINIRLAQMPKDKVVLRLYDASAKLLVSKEIQNEGQYIQLDASFIRSRGTYFLQTIVDGRLFANTLVKQ